MLDDLRGLALNVVHGIERNKSIITQNFFMKFRSLVYRKSSAALTPKSETSEARAIKSSEYVDKSVERSKDISSLELQRLSARGEDPIKGQCCKEGQENNIC